MLKPLSFRASPEQEVVAYHGTVEEYAFSIVEKKRSPEYWLVSDNAYDWLGPGIYFFQDAPLRALLYAEKRADQLRQAKGVDHQPAVIRARFKLGVCLDFLDADTAGYVRFVHALMVADGHAPELPSQTSFEPRTGPRRRLRILEGQYRGAGNILHLLDREVMKYAIEYLNEYENLRIDSIRCAFVDGYPLYSSSWLFDLAHVQLCVLNVGNCIIDEPAIVDVREIASRRDEYNRDLQKMNGRHGDVIVL